MTLAQQHPFEGVERALPTLWRIELHKGAVRWQGVQEREERRQGVLERLVQRQDLPGHLGPHGARVVMRLDMGVAL